jgi:signal transduction histidine kinase
MVLGAANEGGALSIRDDGVGIAEPAAGHTGMGLQIMRYRVSMIGGTLEIARGEDHGTLVRCVFPWKRME